MLWLIAVSYICYTHLLLSDSSTTSQGNIDFPIETATLKTYVYRTNHDSATHKKPKYRPQINTNWFNTNGTTVCVVRYAIERRAIINMFTQGLHVKWIYTDGFAAAFSVADLPFAQTYANPNAYTYLNHLYIEFRSQSCGKHVSTFRPRSAFMGSIVLCVRYHFQHSLSCMDKE